MPTWSGNNSRRSCRISRGGALHRKGKRNSRVVPPFPGSPEAQSITGKPVFPALPRLSSRESTHTTVARGTAMWKRLVGKPRGKASRESHRSLHPREGNRDTAATAREENPRACPHSRRGMTPLGDSRSTQDPCQHLRGILWFRHRLHTRSQAPASTGEESREAPEQLARGLAFPEATRSGP